jgi:hypothetical protein
MLCYEYTVVWCTALWCRRSRIHRYVAAPIQVCNSNDGLVNYLLKIPLKMCGMLPNSIWSVIRVPNESKGWDLIGWLSCLNNLEVWSLYLLPCSSLWGQWFQALQQRARTMWANSGIAFQPTIGLVSTRHMCPSCHHLAVLIGTLVLHSSQP